MNTAIRALMVLAAGMLCAATALAGGAAESGGAAAEVTAATEATVPGKEAPLLAEMVKRGLIPPLEERLPEEPMVVKPLHEPGRYGGTVLMPSTRTDRAMDAHWVFLNFAGGIMPDAENFAPTTPDLSKSFELSPDGRIFTLTLRKGLKWSDGEPFTTDDILYRYEHELLNEELTPRPGGILTLHGEPIELQQVDEQTVRLIFPQPNPVILEQMATHVGLVHEWASPAHFFKELHAEFAGNAAANRNARDAGFDNWYDYYWDRYPRTYSNQTLPGQGPVLNPYLLVDRSESRWIYERNPYYWRVDEQGRQLPYIDRVSRRAGGEQRDRGRQGDQRRARHVGDVQRPAQDAAVHGAPRTRQLPSAGMAGGVAERGDLAAQSQHREAAVAGAVQREAVQARAVAGHRSPGDLRAGVLRLWRAAPVHRQRQHPVVQARIRKRLRGLRCRTGAAATAGDRPAEERRGPLGRPRRSRDQLDHRVRGQGASGHRDSRDRGGELARHRLCKSRSSRSTRACAESACAQT